MDLNTTSACVHHEELTIRADVFYTMSKFVSTTFGLISGRHGSAVAAVNPDGTNVLRVYNRPSNPNSPKQQEQRAKFGLVTREISNFREVIKQGHKNPYAVNKVISQVLKTGITGVMPDFKINYEMLPLASGPLPGVSDVLATAESESTRVILTWDTTIGTLGIAGSETDKLNIVAYNVSAKMCVLNPGVGDRQLGSSSLELPEGWMGDEVHLWAYMSREDGSVNSDSLYVGVTQL